MKKKFHILPNVITAFGLTCGLFVIYKLNMLEPGISPYEIIKASAILLLISALADVLDGAVARLTNSTSDFGMIFDSLSDAVTFGITPTIILLETLSWQQKQQFPFFITTSAMIYTICGILRLVRYSVNSYNTKDDEILKKARNKNFTGLPIPAAAAALVSADLFFHSLECNSIMPMQENIRTITLVCIMVVLGYLMISRWKFPSLKALRLRVRSFNVVLITTIAAVLLLYGLLNHFSIVFVSLSWLYIAIAFILSITRLITGKKVKQLDDYEPDANIIDIE